MLFENDNRDLSWRRNELGICELGLQAVLLTYLGKVIQSIDPLDQTLAIAVDAVVVVARQVLNISFLSVAAQINRGHDDVVDLVVLLAVFTERRHPYCSD